MITPEERAAARRRLAEARTDGTLAAALEELSASTDEVINDARLTVRAKAEAEAERRVKQGDGLTYDMEVDAFVAGALWQAERVIANIVAEGGS